MTPRLRTMRSWVLGGAVVSLVSMAVLACYSGDEGAEAAGTRTPQSAYVPTEAPEQNPVAPGVAPPPPGPGEDPDPPPPQDGGGTPMDSGNPPPQDSGGD